MAQFALTIDGRSGSPSRIRPLSKRGEMGNQRYFTNAINFP